MPFILYALGLVQMAAGAFVLFAAKSAMHETTAAAAFGLGTVTLALAAILEAQTTKTQSATILPAKSGGDLITIYRMYDIRRAGSGVTAAGSTFANVDEAKAYIDKRERGEA